MVKGDSGAAPGHWAIKGADAQTGTLKTYWDGHRAPRYAPMKKQGAIILGIGGDNSDGVHTVYRHRAQSFQLQQLRRLRDPLRGRVREREERRRRDSDDRRRARRFCMVDFYDSHSDYREP